MATKQEALAELDAAHATFRGKIAGLPEDAFHETWLGTWNLSETLAHMGGWWNEMTGAIERAGRGERPTPEGVDYGDADAWNAKFSATASPGKAALAVWDLRYRQYRDAAAALDEGLFGVGDNGKPKIGNRLLDGAGIHHFAEHQPQVDAWLASR
jgi:hypothetical protein